MTHIAAPGNQRGPFLGPCWQHWLVLFSALFSAAFQWAPVYSRALKGPAEDSEQIVAASSPPESTIPNAWPALLSSGLKSPLAGLLLTEVPLLRLLICSI